MANTIKSQESLLLTVLKRGKYFFTIKSDKDMTALATYYNRRIKTERMFAINPRTGKVQKITKVIMA